MKKLFIALVMCLVAMAANAQNGWDVHNLDDDDVVYYDINNVGELGFYVNSGFFYVHTTSGVFNFDEDTGYIIGVSVSLYDINGKLTKKYTTDKFFAGGTYRDFAICRSQDINDAVTGHLCEKNGFVKVIAKRYNNTDLIVKVPCVNNPKKRKTGTKRKH